MMLPIPAAGRLVAVHGQDEARAVPHITALEISIPIGGQVRPLPEGDRYLGFLFARASNPSEVEEALRTAHGLLEIVIDPGQAFGTGAHASTRLCLELLLNLAAIEQPPGALLDVGTGSGVLAIAAAKLGFAPVVALDHDRESAAAARPNPMFSSSMSASS